MIQHKEALIPQIGWDIQGNVYKGYWLENEFIVPLEKGRKKNSEIELHIPADEMRCWYEETLLLMAAKAYQEEHA